MIELVNVNKSYKTLRGSALVLRDINLSVAKGERVGILGRNGAGKSTLIRVVGGVEQPTTGHVYRDMSISWPLAFSGAFQHSLTGFDNLKFICRIYDIDPEDKLEQVDDFAELGKYMFEPISSYSSGMRARLGFAISFLVEFDCYLIDEVTAVGDDRFRERCHEELFVKRADRAMFMVSHNAAYIRENCHKAAVLTQGAMTSFDDLDEAYNFYHAHAAE
jgi:capsular polysaccharide transport system ATP-binding protein